MKYIKMFEEKRGRPKTKWVECIKDYDYILGDDHVRVNPQLVRNDKKLYTFFEKGKMYKMHGPLGTINDGKFAVYVDTNIKHCDGPPDYPKFIYMQFLFGEKSKDKFSGGEHFEDFFKMTEETKELIKWWFIMKDAEKYNI